MYIVNMHEAKTKPSQLVEEALSGKDVVLARAGKPVVRLVPYEYGPRPRKPGRFRGKINFKPDFDQTPEEVISLKKSSGSWKRSDSLSYPYHSIRGK